MLSFLIILLEIKELIRMKFKIYFNDYERYNEWFINVEG